MQIAITVIGCLCAALLALIAAMLRTYQENMQKELATFREQMKTDLERFDTRIATNGRHLDSVMTSLWGLTWRMNGVEDFLSELPEELAGRFRPPRIIGENPNG